MSVAERKARSQLAQWVARRGILRASLPVRRRVCGKAACKCTRGELHERLQYYHRHVTLQWVGREAYLMLDAEPLTPGEDQTGAALRWPA